MELETGTDVASLCLFRLVSSVADGLQSVLEMCLCLDSVYVCLVNRVLRQDLKSDSNKELDTFNEIDIKRDVCYSLPLIGVTVDEACESLLKDGGSAVVSSSKMDSGSDKWRLSTLTYI